MIVGPEHILKMCIAKPQHTENVMQNEASVLVPLSAVDETVTSL